VEISGDRDDSGTRQRQHRVAAGSRHRGRARTRPACRAALSPHAQPHAASWGESHGVHAYARALVRRRGRRLPGRAVRCGNQPNAAGGDVRHGF
jgi:hypothetical protein